MIATVAWVLATERWKVAGLAVLNFHIHLVKDILGSQGPDGYQWPTGTFLHEPAAYMEWSVGPERGGRTWR